MRLLMNLSFRQWLLLALLLVGSLLGTTAVWSLVTVDRLMAASQERAQLSIALSSAAQSLGELGLEMERSARQSLVLADPSLLRQFNQDAAQAESMLGTLESLGLPPAAADAWRKSLSAVNAYLRLDTLEPLAHEPMVAQHFQDIRLHSARIGQQVQELIAANNAGMERNFDQNRRQLAQLVVGTLLLALLLALAAGVWLARPFEQLERAIAALGENRFDLAIAISGPRDVRRLGQRLAWLRERLSELDADKARFLRHVSHELKTPLAALHEGVAVLKDGVAGPLTTDQSEVVHILEHNTLALQRQIESLLSFNAAAFEARQLRRQPVALRSLIEEVVETQKLQWQAQSLRIKVQGDEVDIAADRDKLACAVGNLLSNAIRYSPPRGAISIALAADAAWVTIDVIDQGPGIAEPDRARVFEPFYRGLCQPEHGIAGSGIGLSIVQEYIQAHGGSVRLLDCASGTQMQIRLPRTE